MFNRGRIEELRREVGSDRFALHYGDLGDSSSLHRVIAMVRPDEIYNLAAQSHVGISFDQPEYTTDVPIDPLWSTQRITFRRDERLRPKPMRSTGLIVR